MPVGRVAKVVMLMIGGAVAEASTAQRSEESFRMDQAWIDEQFFAIMRRSFPAWRVARPLPGAPSPAAHPITDRPFTAEGRTPDASFERVRSPPQMPL